MSKQMLVLQLSCPHCNALLTHDSQLVLDGYVKDINQDGEIRLSAVFGEYAISSSLQIPEGAVVQFRCPKCDQSVMISAPCHLCGAPVVSVNQVGGGGFLEFCGRRGCRAHALGGEGDIDEMMTIINKKFNTPYD